jgi:hypothetical protein
MAKQPDTRTDAFDRKWNRELRIVAALVAIFIVVGAVYTLLNGPRPSPGAGGVLHDVEGRTTESGALRPADTER